MKSVCTAIAAVAAAFLVSGCVSATGRAYGALWGSPYSGTRLAVAYAPHEPLVWADIPLEAVFETVLLPVDLVVMPFASVR
jgi:uncharacterized protein YceK